jgi:hypothetical protein
VLLSAIRRQKGANILMLDKDKCRLIHPKDICKGYLKGTCNESDCQGRHHKASKWFVIETGCKRKDDCEFSHDTLAGNQNKKFKCVSCKSEWKDRW